MPLVKAGPNEYLLVGRKGKLENRGSAVRATLMPGTIWVLVPGGKQEAVFEFTQETKDGIPLRFKCLVIWRVTDPVAAASLFDFGSSAAAERISTLLTHVCLGELRHAVSHMTMVECIEERKTTLSGVVEGALQTTIHGTDGGEGEWGIAVEVAQLAQVFIVDAELRGQLEAEVRNDIRLRSDQSDLRTTEAVRLAQMASEGRVAEQQLAGDRERLRRQEELELAEIARGRRMDAEGLATERGRIALEQERLHADLAAQTDRLDAEPPVRLLRISREAEVLRQELELRRLQNEIRALEVEQQILLPRAEQELRRQILPLEQAPEIVASAARLLQGTNLSFYGEGAELLGGLAPVLGELAGVVGGAAAAAAAHRVSESA